MSVPQLPRLAAESVLKTVSRLPAPSASVVELVAAIDDDAMSAAALARLIARDQGLVIRLLAIANSSFYGMAGRVVTIPDAISVLGFRAVRSLAVASGLSAELLRAGTPERMPENFWRHGIATAAAASALARKLQGSEGAALVAGLLHDIGRLALARHFPEHAGEIERRASADPLGLLAIERDVVGIDHAELGGLLAGKWRLPAAICNAIRHHHEPVGDDVDGLICAVHVGDAVAQGLDLAGNADEAVTPIDETCWRRIDLSWQGSQALFAAVERDFAALSQVLL